MSYYKENGLPAAEQWEEEIATEFDDDDELATEFDDDDESVDAEYDDDDDESIDTEFDDDDESIGAEFDDDDEMAAAEFDDDDESAVSDAEIIGLLGGAKLIRSGIRGIRKLVRRPKRRRSYRAYRPKNYLKHRLGRGRFRIPARSRMKGSFRIGRRRFPFKLPTNLATKTDVKRLASQVRKDVRLNSIAIKKNAAGIRSAIGLARKANKGVATVDKKYRSATLRQTRVTNAINKRVVALKKAQDDAQQRAQQQAMFSMFLKPELESLKVQEMDINGNIITGTDKSYKVVESDTGNDMLPLIMGMSGTGSKGGMDPMMMFALMQAFD